MYGFSFLFNIAPFSSIPISRLSRPPSDRAPLPEPYAVETQEAEDFLHPTSNLRAGEEISPAEVPCLGRASQPGSLPQNDGCSGEDLVSKQADEMEVGKRVGKN